MGTAWDEWLNGVQPLNIIKEIICQLSPSPTNYPPSYAATNILGLQHLVLDSTVLSEEWEESEILHIVNAILVAAVFGKCWDQSWNYMHVDLKTNFVQIYIAPLWNRFQH